MTLRRRHSGFTLLELILVMVVVCLAMAIAAPSLRGWNRSSQHRDAADQVLLLMRYARTQAVADAKTHRLNVDAQNGRCWLAMQDGETFVNLDTNLGAVYTLPAGEQIELADSAGTAIQTVDFYPSGRAQVARLRVTSNNNDVTTIQCLTPAEGFTIASAQEQSR